MKIDVLMDILFDATMKNVIYNSMCQGKFDDVNTAKGTFNEYRTKNV